MIEQIPGAPQHVVAALTTLCDELAAAAGPHLTGVVLYGGLARGRFRPGRSDVNVVVLVNDAALTAISPALRKADRAVGVAPLLLDPNEVTRAARAFPTKFSDIVRHHLVLWGVSPFATLAIDREALRQRTVMELMNLLLRLRSRYAEVAGDPASVARALAQIARPLAIELSALLELEEREIPADDNSLAIFEAAAAAFDLDRKTLADLFELRHGRHPRSAIEPLIASTLATLTRAIEIADRNGVPDR